MSQEQENQVEVEAQQPEKSCKHTLLCVLTGISLLFSTVALGLSVYNTVSGNVAGGSNNGEKKVVISKQYDKGQSMEKAIAKNKPIIAFFYTDWCGFCQRFAPTFAKIAKDPQIKKNFAIAFVNCEQEENSKYVQEYEVQGYPTVYVITPDGKKEHLDNNTFFNADSVEVVKNNALNIIGE